jgi:Flp pilus assembly protein TadB
VFLTGRSAQAITRDLLASYAIAAPRGKGGEVIFGRFEKALSLAGRNPYKLARVVASQGLLALTIAVVFGAFYGVIALALVIPGTCWFVRRCITVRRNALDRDLPALLTSIVSSVRAGIDPIVAIIKSAEYLPAGTPLIEGITSLRDRLDQGNDEADEIAHFLEQYEHSDVELFKRCVLLSRKHGCSLSEPLHRITRVIRQRHSFRRKTRAALAMHRMSAFGIALSALVICLIQVGTNKNGVLIALEHPVGSKMLSAGCLLILGGVVWMVSMGREGRI